MKITLEQKAGAQTELIVRCADAACPEVEHLLALLESLDKRIPAHEADTLILLSPQQILYCEFVNRTVFLYTQTQTAACSMSLAQLESEYCDLFRCSKSALVNLAQISHLKSELHGRILATLTNGEKLLISRHYASALRKRLKNR